jgi:NitT/TauT family transport system permease protein
MPDLAAPAPRPEIYLTPEKSGFGIVERPLGVWERLADNGAFRKTLLLLVLAAAWEAYAHWLGNELLFPSFAATVTALWDSLLSGRIPVSALTSIKVLLQGYAAGILCAAVLTALASATRVGADLLETLTSMFNPLPSIALLPLALIWFGFGDGSIIFVLIHAVLWAVALNTHAGFPRRQHDLAHGRPQLRPSARIRGAPWCLPQHPDRSIGWAFAWRTLIAAELVFGASSGKGGLGWFIYEAKNQLEIPSVFAGLFTVILIGLLVENLIFRNIERVTIRRWGMQT